MTRDSEFLALYADAVIVEAIHSTEIGYLIRRAADYWNHYQVPLPREVLLMMLDEPQTEGQKKLDKELILKHYDEAPEPSAAVRPYMEKEAQSWFAKRIMRAGMREAVDFLEQGQVEEARAILNRSLGDSDSIGDDNYGDELVSNVDAYLANLKSLYGDKSRCIPCGMPSLDRAMGGGVRPGELALFMGPPKRGKSHGLIFVARHAFLTGYNVIYYTLEMSPTRIQNRVWSNIINRPAGDDFHQYAPLIEKQARHYAEHPEEVGSLVVQGYPAHQATVAKLHSNLVTLERREGWKPDLIVVDYGELLAPRRDRREERIEQAEIFTDLRSLGEMVDAGVWSASQTNREAAKRGDVRDYDVSEAWGKIMVADYVWGLSQDADEKTEHRMRMTPVAIRNNEGKGDIPFEIDFSRSNFIDVRN